MKTKEKTASVEFTLSESGVLCHALLAAINRSSRKVEEIPPFVALLYDKLCNANDKLMGKKKGKK